MKSALVTIAMMFAVNIANATEEKVANDEKLIKEVKSEMNNSVFFINDLQEEPDVLVYDLSGKLLFSFQKENIDPVAMRNADLLMEINSQKIFIKVNELNPII